jgi:hypothetical protein
VSWTDALVDRLSARRLADGSVGYGYRDEGDAEPTALAAIALHAAGLDPAPSLDWLARLQRGDGGVPTCARLTEPCWPTALALWAFEVAGGGRVGDAARRAERWLLRTEGLALDGDARLIGHDQSIVGWPWVGDTHSWVEPTALALVALRARGRERHDRARQGVRLLEDRCLPDGGWNYGNTRVIRNVLRAFPATTGVALAGLSGGERTDAVERSLLFLSGALESVRTPLSLGWGVLGLSAWSAVPAATPAWLEETAVRERPDDPMHDALLVLASLAPPWLFSRRGEGG